MEKLIITVAPTGNVPTKQTNPNLPVTPDEIVEDVRRCADAGAAVIHVHARDSLQKPTLDTTIYRDYSAIHGCTRRQGLGSADESGAAAPRDGLLYNRLKQHANHYLRKRPAVYRATCRSI